MTGKVSTYQKQGEYNMPVIGGLVGAAGGLGGGGLLSLGMGIAQSVFQFQGKSAAASAQADFQRRQAEANNLAANRRQAELRHKEAQDQEALSRKRIEAQRDLRKGKSTATVAAGEAGVSGSSVDALLQDFSIQSSLYRESLLRQQQFITAGTDLQMKGIQANTQGLNTRLSAPIARPSFAGALFRIGGQVLGAVNDKNARLPGSLTL